MESNQDSRNTRSRPARIASLTGLYLYAARLTIVIEIECIGMKRVPNRKGALQITRFKDIICRWVSCIGSTWQCIRCICTVHILHIMSYGEDGGSWKILEVSNFTVVNPLVVAFELRKVVS